MKNLHSFRLQTICELANQKGLGAVLILIGAIVFLAGQFLSVSQAQRLYTPTRVSSISAQSSQGMTLVTVAADGPLTKAQTWQDDEGYHLVLPDTIALDSLKTVRGVRARRIGSSLEILVQTKPGSRVSINSGSNQLNLTIEGKLETRRTDTRFPVEPSVSAERPIFDDPNYNVARPEAAPLRLSSTVDDLAAPAPAGAMPSATDAATAPITSPVPTTSTSAQLVPQGDGTTAPVAPPSAVTVHPAEDEGLLASVFSGTSVLIVFALGLFGLLVSRKLRSRQEVVPTGTVSVEDAEHWEEIDKFEAGAQGEKPESKSLVRVGESSSNGSARQAMVRMPVAGPTSLYGAYRIDQEVGKLILGQPHRIDVLASRAIDDRRAIEASLIKGVNSTELDESAQKRAREALEEYGFVARQCASLLLAPDAFERTSAARSLGEIKSAAALPFLLESLYDSESIVRNQAVVSIGELKLPSAIGALLDIARTHPDVPSGLLSRTLSACSVEGLDFFDAVMPDPALLGSGTLGDVVEEITHLEPAVLVESLPESSDDPQFTAALVELESIDVDERSEALKTLAQFRVQLAVDSISKVARHDSDPTIRSLAISSLGSINHESVFPAVLIGMADESREVRAAAARSLNRLSFDRADAYVRVIETSDDETIRNVGKACIQAGIVSQNLDRLSNSDHRQAYETFSLICLLAKAGMNDPILDAISHHPNIDVRLKAVHLMASTGHPQTFEHLRELTVKDGIHDEVRTAILAAMCKLDQSTSTATQEDEAAEAFAGEAEALATFENETVEALIVEEASTEAAFEFKPSENGVALAPESTARTEMDEFEF